MDKLSHLQDFLPAFAILINETRVDYNQKIELDKDLRFRQDKDHK